MVVQLIILSLCLFLFLFSLYWLSREDFVFLRKNISLEQVFDVAFIVIAGAVFFSRLFYVIFNFDNSYLNPLVFFLIPYFPGLSLIGGVIGGVIVTLLVTKRKKYPSGRILDFFSVALLATLPIGYLGMLTIEPTEKILFSLLPIVYYMFLFFFYWKILLPKFFQGQVRDGMLGLLFLMNYSLFSLILIVLVAVNRNSTFFSLEAGALLVIFLVSFFLYFRQGAQLMLRRSR